MISDIRWVERTIGPFPKPAGGCFPARTEKILQFRYWEDIDSPHKFLGEWQDVRIEQEEV